MKYNGTAKQNDWADRILRAAELTEEQVENLLRYAGPTLHDQGIMDVTIVIENRRNLAAYADALGEFYKLTPEERHRAAEDAARGVSSRAKEMASRARASMERIKKEEAAE